MARGPTAQFRWEGQQIRKRYREAALRGLIMGGEFILGESRAIVPIDTATLERSGAVTHDERTLTVAISYDTPYAEEVHEDPNMPHAPGRSWKFLEIPFVEHADTAIRILNTQMRKVDG